MQYDAHYVSNRLSRTIGHIKLVRSMVENGADCTDVLLQLAAVRGELDSICSHLMTQYAESFAVEYRRTGDTALIDAFQAELNRAIRK